ncbi:MAG: PAS domain-containing protein, partial [Thalassospira sp.]|uniref:PAS domain-containing protein n=1 Tax=Thalassospira sp. TaxID=1912094 RepID=UPI0032F05AE7
MAFFDIFKRSAVSNSDLTLEALDRSLAVIEFDLKGIVLRANNNFLSVMGYEHSEIVGKHHSIFVPDEIRSSPGYEALWSDLRSGQFNSAAFPRLTKAGRRIWIEATYNPIRDKKGKVTKIVKFASDITARQEKLADFEGKVNAISRSQAVIEFDLGGNILDANDNFLTVMGYQLSEVVGKHHRIFVDPGYAESQAYTSFWRELGNGAVLSQQFKRFAKGGKEIWIEASYNPIFDANGVPYKVVKYATDITGQISLLTDLKDLIDRN